MKRSVAALGLARGPHATLVSCDAAFEGQPDVVCVE